MDTRQRVGIYARVSSQEQATEGVSIEAQVAALKAYAKSQGWGGGRRIHRRRLQQRYGRQAGAEEASHQCQPEAVQYYRGVQAGSLLPQSQAPAKLSPRAGPAGIKFVATQEMLDTSTPYGRFAVQIMGVIAEFERGRIGERVKDSRQYLVARGHWPGGRTIYGYRWLRAEQRWSVDENEAKLVRHIYDLYLKEKLGTMLIPFRLNEEDHRTRLGYRWNFYAVYQVLSHPAYKGLHPKGFKMPAIIDEETWGLAQIRRRQARRIRKSVRCWLLQGRCVCGECGRVLTCQQKDATERRYYSCQGRYKDSHLDGTPRCKLPRIKADMLERAVWDRLKAALTDSETLKESLRSGLAQLKDRREQLCKETCTVDKELEAIAAKKERLGLVFADGAIARDTYQKKLQELARVEKDLLKVRDNLSPEVRVEIDDLEQAIVSLEKTLNAKSGRVLLTELGVLAVDFPEDWIVGYNVPIEAVANEGYAAVEITDVLRVKELGLSMRIVDGPEAISNLEITRDIIWRNIREVFDRLGIKVYIFRDRIEIRGYMPTEVIEAPEGANTSGGGAIIGSARGSGG